jgi:hypothetical protein
MVRWWWVRCSSPPAGRARPCRWSSTSSSGCAFRSGLCRTRRRSPRGSAPHARGLGGTPAAKGPALPPLPERRRPPLGRAAGRLRRRSPSTPGRRPAGALGRRRGERERAITTWAEKSAQARAPPPIAVRDARSVPTCGMVSRTPRQRSAPWRRSTARSPSRRPRAWRLRPRPSWPHLPVPRRIARVPRRETRTAQPRPTPRPRLVCRLRGAGSLSRAGAAAEKR